MPMTQSKKGIIPSEEQTKKREFRPFLSALMQSAILAYLIFTSFLPKIHPEKPDIY
jgi:hypothetical protein